jgi:hypothetical protein
MHCIVVPLKFDDGLSISFLRKNQLFAKKKEVKSLQFRKKLQFSKTFQPLPLGKKADHPFGKKLTFLDLNFFANGIDNIP